MSRPDLILLHPPSVFRFRESPNFYGPVSDVVPSSSMFEIYPIGFLTISEYLFHRGLSVRIVNLAVKMLRDGSFDPEKFVGRLKAAAFGIDLHWLPHADGSLSLAEIVKKHHPSTPVILGGLSSTYYHEEIMRDCPFVDFVLRGDSTEEPLRLLIEAIKSGGGFEAVPNLTWRNGSGEVRVNELTYRPPDLDGVNFDYSHFMRMAVRYRDPYGYIPFKHWLSYPVTAVFQVRGCSAGCASCAGSAPAFRSLCRRDRPCYRSPELLAEDIRGIAGYTKAPVMVIGDLLQAGEEYAEQFLEGMKKHPVDNEITVEFFSPPPERFIRKMAATFRSFNVEMSPESHDPTVRTAFGKPYGNDALEESITALLSAGCRRIDLFFMIGLPRQDRGSVMDTVRYCEGLIRTHDGKRRILPMIAPLAPFIDPGSGIFERPEKYGYRLFYRTLKEHRQAMLMPSWKQTLNYETKWMTRDDIVGATYDAAHALVGVKERHGIVDRNKADEVRWHIVRAKALIEKIDRLGRIDGSIMEEVRFLNNLDSLCEKHELDWPIKGLRLRMTGILRMMLGRRS